ncbi:hypothetical protein [Candidatus Electronema sp. JC]|uniref:hypothetical protein n=1 Tax=Candidatus Electronema sp. JC TaxID=3401570 RepID=UPI003B429B6A
MAACEKGLLIEQVRFASAPHGNARQSLGFLWQKFIRSPDWLWLTRLERSRHINPDTTKNRPVNQAVISEQVDIVHLAGYGLIKVFKKVRTENDIEHWATNDLKMTDLMRFKYAEISWMIEMFISLRQLIFMQLRNS